MPTNKKTSLSIVCFYAIFLMTSCVNSKKNSVTFQSQDKDNQVEVSVIHQTQTALSIELTCVSKTQGIDIKKVRLVCLNPNPIGNSVKVLDTADSKPVQVYKGEYQGNKVRIIVPYGNLEKTKRNLVLNIVSVNKGALEATLVKLAKHQA